MINYRRNLPHWFPDGVPIFITWRLAGSLPVVARERLRETKKLSAGEAFRRDDADLDRAASGPLWLKHSEIAGSVEEAFHAEQKKGQFDLHAYVVMSNHVHLLVTPRSEVQKITRALKGVTARRANSILGRAGRPFWQQESFDHWVRNEGQFVGTKSYIENNPVKAGLVARPEDWPWSSASKGVGKN
jgi:putative transposase